MLNQLKELSTLASALLLAVLVANLTAFADDTYFRDNVAPIFDSTPVTTAAAGQAYQYHVAAHDPNGGPVSYLLDSGPAGMSIDPVTGMLTWMPTAASCA